MNNNKIIFLYSINNYKYNIKKIYIIFSKDIYLNNLIKNKIISYIHLNIDKNIYKYFVKIDNINDYNSFISEYYNKNIFFRKKIIIIYVKEKEFLNKLIHSIYNTDYIILLLYYNNLNLNEINNINKKYNNNNTILFINCYLNNINIFNRTIKYINSKLNLCIINKNIINWIYSLYFNNIFFILQIINILINKTYYKLLNKNLFINKNFFIYYKNNNWINSILLGDVFLSILSLFILRHKTYTEINNFIKYIKKYIIIFYYIKYNIYNLYKIKFLFKIEYKEIFLLFKLVNNLNNNDIYKIYSTFKNIEINILNKNYNYYFYDIWNDLDILTLLICKKKI